MDFRLPVLQYDSDAGAGPTDSNSSTIKTAVQSQANSSVQIAKPPTTCAASKKGILKAQTSASAALNSQAFQNAASQAMEELDQDAVQELSRERKRRAFIGMLRLLEHGAKDPEQLNMLIAPMSDEELLQVAEERSLAGKCGNPLCTNPFEFNEPRQRYRVTADNIHKLEGDCYCSKSCGSFMRQLAVQLVNPMDRIQPRALQQYLAQPSHKPKQGVAAQGGGVPTMKSIIQERDPFQLIHEAEEAGRQLDEAAAQQQNSAQAAAVVEGFTPRLQPTRPQQRQQQQQADYDGDSANADEPLEVLQLNPVLSQDGLVSRNQTAAALEHTNASSTGAGDEQQMHHLLRIHQAHQSKQLQQVNHQQQRPVDVSSLAKQTSAQSIAVSIETAAEAAVSKQGSSPSPGHLPASVTAADEAPGGHRRRRTVTFAPSVEYSCPADPEQHPEQPVLTFTLHQPDGAADDAASRSGAGLVGELMVTSADQLPAGPTAAMGGDVQEVQLQTSAADDSSSADDAAPEMPEAWRLFFPPALGGVGVPVKQVVKTKPPLNTERQRRPNHQQQQQVHHSQPAYVRQTAKQGGVIAADPADVGVAADKLSGPPVSAGHGAHQPQPQQHHAAATSVAVQRPAAAVTAAGQSRQSAAAIATGPCSMTAEAAAGRPRKFTPTVRPRRGVVMLDSVPGVTVKQRGVLPVSTSTGTAAAAVEQSQQQQRQAGPGAPAPGGQLEAGGSVQRDLPAAVSNVRPLDTATSVVAGSINAGGGTEAKDNQAYDDEQWHPSSTDEASRADLALASAHNKQGLPVTQPRLTSLGDSSGNRHLGSSSSDAEPDDAYSVDMSAPAVSSDGDVSDSELSLDSEHESSGDMTQQLQGALSSLLPFLDTKGVTVHLSQFGLLWNAMHAWISPATIAYVNNKQAAASVVAAAVGAAVVGAGGRPAIASETAVVADSAEQEDVPPRHILQQRTALANMLAPALPPVLEQLCISVPDVELSRHLHALVRSFYMSGPLPALQMQQWQIVVALMLAALSAWRVPSMRHVFSRRQASGGKLELMLENLGSDVDRFMALLDLFELDV